MTMTPTSSTPTATTRSCTYPHQQLQGVSTGTATQTMCSVAQKLNNHGSNLLQLGQYEQAILILSKGLKLSEHHYHISCESTSQGCTCPHCTLDACMSISWKTTTTSPSTMTTARHERSQEQHSCESCWGQSQSLSNPIGRTYGTTSMMMNGEDWEEGSNEDRQGGHFLYTTPIYVSQATIQEGHPLGMTLSLILIFNLALAHQLFALQQHQLQGYGDTNTVQELLGKAQQLYELACRLQQQQQQGQVTSSIQFSMVVANNLGVLHRHSPPFQSQQDNIDKYNMCMEYVLSAVIYLQYNEIYEEDQEQDHQGQQQRPSSSSSLDLDGFIQNTCHLILGTTKTCADAA